MERKYIIDYSVIAKRVKFARKAAGLTQEQLAEKINISTNAVAKIENNFMAASLQTLVNISNVLGVDINYFLRSNDDTDRLFDAMISNLSDNEKRFIASVIKALRQYPDSPDR